MEATPPKPTQTAPPTGVSELEHVSLWDVFIQTITILKYWISVNLLKYLKKYKTEREEEE